MSRSGPSADRALLRLGGRQHGLITLLQLFALGLTRGAVDHRVAGGRLHRVHQGVYAVGRPDLTPDGHRLAAVLAFGPTAVLSHASAAGLWDLIGGALHPVHITLPGSGRAQRPGIRVHRTTTLHPEDVLRLNAIPVTSVDRTLLDLAAVVARSRLLHAVEQAEHLRRLDVAGLQRVIARNPRAKGAATLCGILDTYTGAADTRSELERRFRDFVDAHALPCPRRNVSVAGHTVDAFWPDWRLVVELDSIGWHFTRRAFQDDRVRDAALQRAGHRILRITDERLTLRPAAVLHDIRGLAGLA